MNARRMMFTALVTTTFLAAGCAGTTQKPDAAQAKTMTVEQISQQWKQGNDLVAKGDEAKKKAQAKIDAANVEMKEGDAMVSRGRTLMLESEQAFRDTSRKNAVN